MGGGGKFIVILTTLTCAATLHNNS